MLRCAFLHGRDTDGIGAGAAFSGDELVGLALAGEAEFQKVGRESGRPFRRFGFFGMAEGECGENSSRLRTMKFERFSFAEGAKFACAEFDGGGRYVVG